MEDIKSVESLQLDELTRKYSPFLIEIRKRILVSLGIFVCATVIGFIYYQGIIKFLIDLLSLKGVNIVFTSPFQFINLAINCGIATGLVLAFPLLIYQFLSFLKPALKVKEFKTVVAFLPFSIILFLIGFAFGIYMMKWQIQLFLTTSVELGIGNILDITHLISTVLLVSAVMGIAFQFPIALLLLLRLGIISNKQLSKQRLWVYLGAFIFVVILPIDSIMADFLLTLPLIALFELTLIINRLMGIKQVRP